MIPRPVVALGKSCPNNNRAEDFGQPGAISPPSPCFDTLAVSPLPPATPPCSPAQSQPAPTACPACAATTIPASKGVKTFCGPFPVNEGPAAGQSIVYFLAP
jgi:hypothetical protein